MYQINRDDNYITQLKECLFSDLGFKERDHLQEWIAKNPETLGEDLLIIQKEFDGFNQTNERLDLLALDKDGNLVIIENKLDDTGKDVVWQALKYASYCSTLSTSQVIEVFQRFLDKNTPGEEARPTIAEFLGIENEESLVLNRDDQRIIFVANHYRKEVTSTAMWLLEHDLKIQCFRATPYSLGESLFLQVEQIIPVPEVSEFIIDLKEKAKEDKGKSKKVAQTEADLLDFWHRVKIRFSESDSDFLANVSSKPRFALGFSRGKGSYNMVIGSTGTRIEIYFGNDASKQIFETMKTFAPELNAAFDGQLEWQRLDGKKASRIKYEVSWEQQERDFGLWKDSESKSKYVGWFYEEMLRFYGIMQPAWERAQQKL